MESSRSQLDRPFVRFSKRLKIIIDYRINRSGEKRTRLSLLALPASPLCSSIIARWTVFGASCSCSWSSLCFHVLLLLVHFAPLNHLVYLLSLTITLLTDSFKRICCDSMHWSRWFICLRLVRLRLQIVSMKVRGCITIRQPLTSRSMIGLRLLIAPFTSAYWNMRHIYNVRRHWNVDWLDLSMNGATHESVASFKSESA